MNKLLLRTLSNKLHVTLEAKEERDVQLVTVRMFTSSTEGWKPFPRRTTGMGVFGSHFGFHEHQRPEDFST